MGNHICFINNHGKLKCWGYNSNGQLGLGHLNTVGNQPNQMGIYLPFVNVGDGLVVDQVSFSNYHTCVHFTSNQIKCWGSSGNGETGLGMNVNSVGGTPSTTPDKLDFVNLGTLIYPTQVVCGALHSCVLFNNNQVKCFGHNQFGQVGLEGIFAIGKSSTDMGDNLPFISLGSGVSVESIHSDPMADHNCVILSITQLVKCWGKNGNYELGYGDYTARGYAANTMGDNLPTVDLGVEDKVNTLQVGILFTCAIRIDDVLVCWGNNAYGQLGLGTPISIVIDMGSLLTPTLYDSGKKIKQISTGSGYLCLLFDDNITLKCIGQNDNGMLGQGDTIHRGKTPETTFPNITAIDLGTGNLQISFVRIASRVSCVSFVDNRVKCFGNGVYGELGSGSSISYGSSPSTMGSNLPYVDIFTTFAPTTSPTPPTFAPTLSPTATPTKSPTYNPSSNPTKTPLAPTKAPTKHPTSTSTKQCDYQSAKLCKYDFKCTWKNVDGLKQCVVFDCMTLNKGKCGKERNKCKWNKKTSLCDAKLKG